jgi:hypothetical protein
MIYETVVKFAIIRRNYHQVLVFENEERRKIFIGMRDELGGQ